MSLYASRDGALYQSYDDFAGSQGFHEPSDPNQIFDPVRYARNSEIFVEVFDLCVRSTRSICKPQVLKLLFSTTWPITLFRIPK